MLLIWLALALSQVKLGGKSIVTYWLLYLLGYFVLSEDKVIDRLQKWRFHYLLLWIAFSAVNVWMFLWSGKDYGIVNLVISYCAGCFGIMTMLSVGKNLLSRTNSFLQFLSSQSFLIYIFHFPWVVALQYLFSGMSQNNTFIFCATTICALPATVLTSILVRNIPVVNILFGAKK